MKFAALFVVLGLAFVDDHFVVGLGGTAAGDVHSVHLGEGFPIDAVELLNAEAALRVGRDVADHGDGGLHAFDLQKSRDVAGADGSVGAVEVHRSGAGEDDLGLPVRSAFCHVFRHSPSEAGE